jgi:hypothetical protein
MSSMGKTDVLMPSEMGEMSMLMGIANMLVPSETSEMIMLMGLTDTSISLETSQINFYEANTAGVSASR